MSEDGLWATTACFDSTPFMHHIMTFMQHNIDITEDMIPVRPAAHFFMGGVRTDLDGRASVAGLYAAGEVAATGVTGPTGCRAIPCSRAWSTEHAPGRPCETN